MKRKEVGIAVIGSGRIGTLRAKLSAKRFVNYPVPKLLRTFSGTYRVRAALPQSTTTTRATSAWFYVRIS